MNFNKLLLVLAIGFAHSGKTQTPELPDSTFRHHRFLAGGVTPLTTLNRLSFSFEFGYSLSRRFQLMAGPKFYVMDYPEYSSVSNPLGSFYGAFLGGRMWWHGIPNRGWSYFSSTELHYRNPYHDGGGTFRPTNRHYLSPELGHGFGRFSENGFYFLFNFNFAFDIRIRTNVGGDVYSSLRLSAGIRL